MIVVADAGPIHYLVLIDFAGVLEYLYGRVILPQTVAAELSAVRTPAVLRNWMMQPPSWIDVQPDPPPDGTLSFLDPGEGAAILLAESMRAERLLIDEWKGRSEAERRHLQITGTLGVLAEAHQHGLLNFELALTSLHQTNFYLSAKLVDRIRRQLQHGP